MENTIKSYEAWFNHFCEAELGSISDCYIYSNRRDSFLLSNLIKQKSGVLVMLITQYSCGQCVNLQIEALAKIQKNVKNDKIIVLSSYPDYRGFYALGRKYDLNIGFYYVNQERLHFSPDKMPGPSFFYLDQELTIKLIFSPIKENPELTLNYLHMLNSRLLIN